MYRKWTTDISLFIDDYTVYIFARSVLGILSCIVGVGYAFLSSSSDILLPFVLALIIHFVGVYFDLNNTYFISRNQANKRMIAITLERVVGIVLGIGVLLTGHGLIWLLFSYVASRTGAILVQLLLYPFRITTKIPLGSLIDRSISLIIKAHPFFLAGIFFNLYYRVDNLVLKYFVPFDQLAYYNVAFQIIVLINTIPVMFQQVLFPSLNNIYEKQYQDFIVLFNRSMKYITALSIGIVFGIFFLAPRIITELFTSSYMVSATVLQILVLSNLPIFVNVQLINLLMIQKKEKYIAWITMIVLIVNIILDIVLVQLFSIYGVAMGTFICEITLMSMLYKASKISLNILKSLLISLVCAAFMAISLILLIKLPLILLVPIGAGIYIMFQFIFKNFKLTEIML
jgi:O-antigen/teichoic acid export membrane protein